MRVDYYRVLGVAPDADPEVIRLAWRTLAMEHHPDRRGHSDGDSMTLLNEAWATLRDRELRAAYDLSRAAPEPRPVQDAVLAAVRDELSASGEISNMVSANDLLLVKRELRVAVRLVRVLDSGGLRAWLRSVQVPFRGGEIDGAVVVACRVLVREETALRVGSASFPAAAVDLTESVAFGLFAPGGEELFRPFLVAT